MTRTGSSSFDPSPSAVALLDARFTRWLAHLDEGDAPAAAPLRTQLVPALARVLEQNHLRRGVRRLYWYAEADDRAVVDDQTLRLVPAEDGDGAALVRQMSADMAALVASGRVDVLIIGSDDDRLMAAIDAAKLAGVTVCLLADERALSMPRLFQQDPNWARLLREADRRLVIRSADLAQLLSAEGASGLPGTGTGEPGTSRRDVASDEDLHAVVSAWWADLPPGDRDTLRNELPALRGLPPEVDRELLLRGKNALTRALNFHEKRILRAHARLVALGQAAADEPDTGAGPAAADD